MSDRIGAGKKPPTALVIAAAGRSSRMGGSLPKQFKTLGGITLLEWTLRKAAVLPFIDDVVVLVPSQFLAQAENLVHGALQSTPEEGVRKRYVVMSGGETRLETVVEGAAVAASRGAAYVLIHDAARPFASLQLFEKVAAALWKGSDAVVPVVPQKDTLKRLEPAPWGPGEARDRANSGGPPGGQVRETVDRSVLAAAQTPQGLSTAVIEAYLASARSDNEPRAITDDVGIAELMGFEVVAVEGEEANFKVTTEYDLAVAQAMVEAGIVEVPQLRLDSRSTESSARLQHPLQLVNPQDDSLPAPNQAPEPPSPIFTTGIGVDVHRLEEGDSLVLCGVKIPSRMRLQGHSDGDVAFHAVVDALLGAASLGDIGEWFPSEDPTHKGRPSSYFVEKVSAEIRKKGFEIVSVDVTIVAQQPRLEPYKQSMRRSLASLLRIPETNVSVKATTTDGLGFLGRGEGIAALATAVVVAYRE
jgi:2-C-methyl-D-erythritol 4-phosphate cytidylyltransferase/2-C-methyl-D-erythritol 2,4-cyclodiphosphate synthase